LLYNNTKCILTYNYNLLLTNNSSGSNLIVRVAKLIFSYLSTMLIIPVLGVDSTMLSITNLLRTQPCRA